MPAKNILEIKDDFDVFVFDIYGVIWDGKKVIAGFDEVMKILTQSGKRVVIMSNSTALCRARDSDSPFAGQSSKGWEERSVLSHGWGMGVLFGSRCLIRPTKRRFERDVA